MRKSIITLCALLTASTGYAQKPSDTPASQMEKLDRGLVVVPQSNKHFISWRMLGTDTPNTSFEVLKNGQPLKSNIIGATFLQTSGSATDTYQVNVYQNGQLTETTMTVSPWSKGFLELPLDKPADGSDYTYSPNDCSVGDVDGDGEYEIFVKWDPSNSKDNSQDGITGPVLIDCYKLDGTKLWRIDLGQNIRAGAHYTQFMVYDFDGDGKAEMMCKTAPGSKDGEGTYVNQATTNPTIKAASNTKSWLTSSGRMDGGHEYLTVFNGTTGKAIHTIAYFPNRNTTTALSEADGTFNWAVGKTDNHGYNRGDRYLAAVAYLSGQEANPSGIFCRGYYSYAYVWAVDFDGTQLKHRWLHRSDSNTQWSVVDANMQESAKVTAPTATSGGGSNTMFANGNHNLSVGDVDGDGKDEIIWGAAALDDNGSLLYATGFGHGDAIHLGDLNPDRQGLEVFDVHEEKGTYAWDIHDAATGEILMKSGQSGKDNGRGLAADIIADARGYEFWSAYGGFNSNDRNQNPFNAITKEQVGNVMPSMNFRIYWDGDAQDELLDDINIYKYQANASASRLGLSSRSYPSGLSNNGTKATPCLSADIFGDWREELILRNATNDALNIYTSLTSTNYRVPTLMHDHVYRMGICWQNVAYNQPPHLGYYLPDYIESFQGVDATGIQEVQSAPTTQAPWYYNLQGQRIEKPQHGIYIHNGKKYLAK
ncbi:rhamnogalacturonan lyase [Xylanibacter brevis]|uniref:rhamnogalacturonan lyase n=1 Tax=Xylanibacter brevis TaxID=83231 RepID=UPI000A6C6039|nr:rhamnogalacturonan lyase [Xylanibacter brevis]